MARGEKPSKPEKAAVVELAPSVRGDGGRFAPGCPGGPGRPAKALPAATFPELVDAYRRLRDDLDTARISSLSRDAGFDGLVDLVASLKVAIEREVSRVAPSEV